MMKRSCRLGKTRKWGIALILLLAAVLRVVYLSQYQENSPFRTVQVADSQYYDTWAMQLANGEDGDGGTYYQPPLYPFLLGGIYKTLSGLGGIEHRFLVVAIVQLCLGLLSIYLVYSIGRKVFGDAAGLLGAMLMLSHGNIMFWEVKLLITTLQLALGLLLLRTLLASDHRPKKLVLAGVIAGLLCLARADKLIFLPFAAIWIFSAGDRKKISRPLLFLVPAIALVLVATLRNQVVADDPVLISSNGGINFHFGNHEGATGINMGSGMEFGSLFTQMDTAREVAEADVGEPLRDSQVSSYWFQKGLDYICEDPGGAARLWVNKALLSISDLEADIGWMREAETPYAPVLGWLFLPFGVLLGLGLAGAVLSLRNRGAWLLLLYVLSTLAVIIIFFMGSRFRLGATPCLAILGGQAIVLLVNSIRGKHFLRTCGIVILVLCPAVLAHHLEKTHRVAEEERPLRDFLLANTTQIIGQAHAQLGEISAARNAFRRVLEWNPYAFKARYGLGKIAHHQALSADDPAQRALLVEAAQKNYQRACSLMPAWAEVHAEFASLLLEPFARDTDAALKHLSIAADLEPGHVGHRVLLVETLVSANQYDEAASALQPLKGRKDTRDEAQRLEKLIRKSRSP